jgi:hypothetical protein
MAIQKFEWILDRITQVEREDIRHPESASVRDDADDLIGELLIHASDSIDFVRLSIHLNERQTLDSLKDDHVSVSYVGPVKGRRQLYGISFTIGVPGDRQNQIRGP